MFSKNQISLFIIVFSFMIMIGVGLRAHPIHNVNNPELNFTSNPDISCNIDGWTFTHTRVTDYDGSIEQDWWYRIPKNPEFKIEAEAHGFGWAHITFYGNYDGKSYGDAVNPTSEKLGSWLAILPLAVGIDHDIELAFDGTFNHSPKTYSWDGNGSIKLVPYYWKWQMAGIIPAGSWEPAPDDFHRTLTDSATGNWTVVRNWKTLKKKQLSGSPNNDDGGGDGGGGDDEEEEQGDAGCDTDTPNLGISPADSEQIPQPGDSATLTLVTEEAYDYVNWHVKAPWETSERGTCVECDWGDGTINEATFSYTFPSGAMHTGDFLITAVICRWSDLSEYEETYTVTVDMTPNCDDCTDESSTCPNAGAH